MILTTQTLLLNTAHLAVVSLHQEPKIVLKCGAVLQISKKDAEYVMEQANGLVRCATSPPPKTFMDEQFEKWWDRGNSRPASDKNFAYEAWCAAKKISRSLYAQG